MLKKLCLVAFAFIGLYAKGLEGYYLTHKDEKGKQVVVEIFEHGGKYHAYGFANTDGSKSVDQNNPDAKLKGRSMNGVVFVWNLAPKGNEWSDGKIYNVANGKTYDASVWFDKSGNLVVKASVWGFGKKFVWTKLSEEEAQKYFATKPPIEQVIKTIP
ncbi:DUF2147 domain-containing protein [Helicobacter pametensis]|uniref:DUF2147 domain-containing protein n=1 Tax=Helicobacter pametensis TaxID=95149 RepID=UPI0004B2298B|nr:DUF2147 domain-containing protein [Helicobacter pametensis]